MLSLPLDRSGHRFEHEAMNCMFIFVLGGAEESYLAQAALAAGELLDQLENYLSLYRENSDVSRINAAAPGDILRVAEETAACLALAMRIARQTAGAYHPFFGAEAMRAKGQELPEGVEIATLAHTEPVIELDIAQSMVAKRRAGGLLDLGGIGKGFALDRLRALLVEEWEIPRGLLVAGGSSILGFSVNGVEPWRVRFAAGGALPALENAALGSSGLGFQPEHIINPFSQRPVNQRRQVWVHAPGAGAADALATAAMVLDDSHLASVFSNLDGVSLYLKNDDNSQTMGPYFDGSVIPTSPSNPKIHNE